MQECSGSGTKGQVWQMDFPFIQETFSLPGLSKSTFQILKHHEIQRSQSLWNRLIKRKDTNHNQQG